MVSVSSVLSPLGWSDSSEKEHAIVFLKHTGLAASFLGPREERAEGGGLG